MAFLKLLNEGHFVFGEEATPVLSEILDAFNKFHTVYTECIMTESQSEELINNLKSVKAPLSMLHSSLELRLVNTLRII